MGRRVRMDGGLGAAGGRRGDSDRPGHGRAGRDLLRRSVAEEQVSDAPPTDTEMVDTILTAELIMNKSIYADAYVEAFRKT